MVEVLFQLNQKF